MKIRKQPPTTLASYPELEATIAHDPFDELAWSVLADYLLEVDDARTDLVLAERAGDSSAIERARKIVLPLLLGEDAVALIRRIRYATEWRAGFIRTLTFTQELHQTSAATERALFGALLASPAARLVRALTLPEQIDAAIPVIAAAPCARSLRSLELGSDRVPAVTEPVPPRARRSRGVSRPAPPQLVPAGVELAPLAHVPITELRLVATYPTAYTPGLARLRKLALHPASGTALAALFPADGYPELRELAIVPDHLGDVAHAVRLLEELLAGRAAPQLAVLSLENCESQYTAPIIEVLSRTELLRKLRVIKLGLREHSVFYQGQYLAPTQRPPASFGKAFAHLERITVPSPR